MTTPLIHHSSNTKELSQFRKPKSSNNDTVIEMYLKYNTTRASNNATDRPQDMNAIIMHHSFDTKVPSQIENSKDTEIGIYYKHNTIRATNNAMHRMHYMTAITMHLSIVRNTWRHHQYTSLT